MILGVGIELVEASRFESVVADREALDRLFTASELEYCLAHRVAATHLAARYAAKSACLKAIGLEPDESRFRDMDVVRDEKGKPSLHLTGNTRAHLGSAGIDRLHVSLSHSGGHGVAMVLAEGVGGSGTAPRGGAG